jgi:N-acetylglucosaminyl-diphospho-decaprenol L-rhamnosyltransferase
MDRANRVNVLIVIVNYRTAELSIACLRSLENEVKTAASGLGRVRVAVTDNASGDDSVQELQEAVRNFGWDEWASIQPLERNGGFAYGNNASIRPALESSDPTDFIWLLNPDTVVRPGALASLVEFLESHPEAGIAGCRLLKPDGTPEWSAFRFPSVLGELENGVRLGFVSKLLARWVVSPPAPSTTSPCDWASGASLLIRRAVFQAIGLLDEGYFLYFEEVDFCLRARRAGWTCWYVPEAQVLHLGGQSSGLTGHKVPLERRPGYWFASRRYYFRKHLGPVRTLLADLAWSLGFLSFRIRQSFQRCVDNEPPYLLRDFVSYNFLPARRPAERLGRPGRIGIPS